MCSHVIPWFHDPRNYVFTLGCIAFIHFLCRSVFLFLTGCWILDEEGALRLEEGEDVLMLGGEGGGKMRRAFEAWTCWGGFEAQRRNGGFGAWKCWGRFETRRRRGFDTRKRSTEASSLEEVERGLKAWRCWKDFETFRRRGFQVLVEYWVVRMMCLVLRLLEKEKRAEKGGGRGVFIGQDAMGFRVKEQSKRRNRRGEVIERRLKRVCHDKNEGVMVVSRQLWVEEHQIPCLTWRRNRKEGVLRRLFPPVPLYFAPWLVVRVSVLHFFLAWLFRFWVVVLHFQNTSLNDMNMFHEWKWAANAIGAMTKKEKMGVWCGQLFFLPPYSAPQLVVRVSSCTFFGSGRFVSWIFVLHLQNTSLNDMNMFHEWKWAANAIIVVTQNTGKELLKFPLSFCVLIGCAGFILRLLLHVKASFESPFFNFRIRHCVSSRRFTKK